MADAEVEVLINSISNTAGFATAKAELASLQTSPYSSSFGGQLSSKESTYATSQLAGLEAQTVATKELSTAERDLATEGSSVARAASAMGVSAADAGGRLASLAGVMGSTGSMGLAAGAAIVGMGLWVETGKAVIQNTEAQDAANRSLAQAYKTLGESVPSKEINDFINQNTRFLPSMFAAEQGFASLARAGFDNTTQLRLMNDALDLSVAKGISLDQAVTILTAGSQGMSRGLLDLGISSKEVNAALAKGSTEGEKFQELLALLEPKIAGARDTTGGLDQNTNRLNEEWQHLTSQGQLLPDIIGGVEGKLADLLIFLSTSDATNGFFSDMQQSLIVIISLFEVLNYQMITATNNWANATFGNDPNSIAGRNRNVGRAGPMYRSLTQS